MPARRGSSSPSNNELSSSDGEQDFLDSLTRKQVLEISEAFDSAARDESSTTSNKAIHEPANKRRRLDKGKGKATKEESQPAPGGFLVGDEDDDDDDDEGAAGGFVKDTGVSSAGGFLLDEEDDDDDAPASAGGFMPSASSKSRSGQRRGGSPKAANPEDKATSILLDNIPSVLESLGLDGDDPSILSIFENASFEDKAHDGLQAVKRKDFLKVAAILITQRDNERPEDAAHLRSTTRGSSKKGKEKARGTYVSSGGGRGRAVNMDADEVNADEHDDSDPLILESEEEDEDDDQFNRDNEDSDPWADEDEMDGAFTGGKGSSPPTKRRITRSRAKDTSPLSSLPSDDDDTEISAKGKKSVKSRGKGRAQQKTEDPGKYRLSSRQKEECNKMFQQFFASNDKSRNKAISMAEIRYVATLLNEKISDEDVIEMLEYASSTRDRSVNLEAFSKIMVDVKAV